MAKSKVKESLYQNWSEVDTAMRRMGEIDIELTFMGGNMTDEVNAIKKRYSEKAAPLQEERKTIESGIKDYVEEHKDEFVKTRTRDLVFGKVFYRISCSIKILSKEACVKALRAFGYGQMVRVSEEPDKDAMAALDDAELLKVSARREHKDQLTIEPDIEKIKSQE